MLETILSPSKAIAPEYVPHLVQTAEGQVLVGFVLEKSERQWVFKDAESKLLRFAPNELEAVEPQTKSIMPELVLRDITPQDAADLLAFLTGLRDAVQPVTRARACGPFRDPQRGIALDLAFPPERDLAEPALAAEYRGAGERPCRWELATAVPATGATTALFPPPLRGKSKTPGKRVVWYYLIDAESAGPQQAELQISSTDAVRAWLHGEPLSPASEANPRQTMPLALRAGRNPIIVKVASESEPAGLKLSIASPGVVILRTE